MIALETAFAKATPKRADLRDPYKTYNPTSLDKPTALAPHVPWKSFFATYNPPAFATINVAVPAYLTAYDEQLAANAGRDVEDLPPLSRRRCIHGLAAQGLRRRETMRTNEIQSGWRLLETLEKRPNHRHECRNAHRRRRPLCDSRGRVRPAADDTDGDDFHSR